MSGSYSDKRVSKRIPYPVEAEFYGVGVSPVNLRIGDLSATGAFIDTITALPLGSVLSLRFVLESTEISVQAQVCYSMPQIGMGVRFLDLAPDQRDLIQSVVQKGSA